MLPKKCKYALRAIFELAGRDNAEPVKIQKIAQAQDIPQRFLEIILAELKNAGFVTSRRGADGGYLLALDPAQITVGQVLTHFGQAPATAGDQQPQRSGDYAFAKLWMDINRAMTKIYDNTTFADLLNTEKQHRKGYIPNYVI